MDLSNLRATADERSNEIRPEALHPLAFLGLLLVTASAFPNPKVQRGEGTGDTTANKPTYTSAQNTENLMTFILRRILDLRTELCDNDEDCLENEEALSENNLNLPTMLEKDGCFQAGYNRHSCLLKTTSGLLEFQIYLEYIQNHLSDDQKDIARDIQSNSKSLVEILKQEIKNPNEIVFPSPTANASLMKKLESQHGWQKTMTMQLILRSLQDFLQYALRAFRN
uniref:interleukin-6 n=1 Tax=Jaculus jaculus TaxID=51337 RepID=UPI001E1B388C|nr:interleukin-6 [Jaculus jaculus]